MGGGVRIGEQALITHCWFNSFSLALSLIFPPFHPATQGDIVRWSGLGGGGLIGGLGQAEFTYLSAGSLPDFTEDIGGQ